MSYVVNSWQIKVRALPISHSVLSFALFEIAVPNYPLFSLLCQKIDVFLNKNFLGGHLRKGPISNVKVLFQFNLKSQISNNRQKFQKPKKKLYLKTLIMNFEQPCWK